MVITVAIFTGTYWLLGLSMQGSFVDLFLLTLLGAIAMISMGLIISARTTSEELASGLLNMLSWPMMFLSGVWFSLEGAPDWIKQAAEFFPLTHLTNGARAIMLDGAGIASLGYEMLVLAVMAIVFLLLGAVGFKWSRE